MNTHLLNEMELVLSELTNELESLVSCLKEEREAVIEMSVDRITESLKKKNETLLRIQGVDRNRQTLVHQLAASLGVGTLPNTKPPRLESLLERLPRNDQTDKLRLRVSCVKSLAQAAQEFNDAQQMLVLHSLKNVQMQIGLLDKLTGKTIDTYNHKGVVGVGRASTTSSVMNRTV